MKRNAMDKLKEWKNRKDRKPLILHGARQVGKTWLMKEFGKECYKDYIYVYFMDNPKMEYIFNKDSDVRRIIEELETEFNRKITPETLLIFDEIQEVPKALSSLKRFCEELPQYHIICAGSLMGLALHQGTNYPVGKVDMLNIYPMTFDEFLTALGMERYVRLIKDHNFGMISSFKEDYITALKKYYIVGGMPAAVQSFAQEGDFRKVKEIQSSIITAYESDFSKHAPNNEVPKIRNVWEHIPMQLAKDSKKFIYKNLGNGARARDYEYSLMWMNDCGLISQVYKVTNPNIPLKFYFDQKSFKVYMNDIGLLSNMCQADPRDILEKNKLLVEFKGALTEQFVCQELKAMNEFDFAYYTNEKNTCEVDFIAKLDRDITPIEVKADINLQAKSLKTYMEKYKPEYAVRLSLADYKVTDNLYDIPLYAISALKEIISK